MGALAEGQMGPLQSKSAGRPVDTSTHSPETTWGLGEAGTPAMRAEMPTHWVLRTLPGFLPASQGHCVGKGAPPLPPGEQGLGWISGVYPWSEVDRLLGAWVRDGEGQPRPVSPESLHSGHVGVAEEAIRLGGGGGDNGWFQEGAEPITLSSFQPGAGRCGQESADTLRRLNEPQKHDAE